MLWRLTVQAGKRLVVDTELWSDSPCDMADLELWMTRVEKHGYAYGLYIVDWD